MKNIKYLLVSKKQREELLEDIIAQLQEGDSTEDIAQDMFNYGKGIEKELGQRIANQIDLGEPISPAFHGIYPEIAVQCITAGEEIADLVVGFKNAIDSLQGAGSFGGMFAKTLMFPVLVFSGSVYLIIYLASMLMESFSAIIPVNQWPATSIMFIEYTQYWQDSWFTFVIKLVAITAFAIMILKSWANKYRHSFDSLPVFHTYKMVVAGQILNTLSLMLQTGNSMDRSLEFCSRSGSRYQRFKVSEVQDNLDNTTEESGNAGVLLDVGLMDERQINRLKKRGDRAQNLPDLLKNQAVEMHSKVTKRLGLALTMTKMFIWGWAVMNMAFMLFAILSLSVGLSNSI